MKRGVIPPHLHFSKPNPHIPWETLPVAITTAPVPWMSSNKPRIAAVSSFGFAGSNAHVIVEEAPKKNELPSFEERTKFLLTISGATREALVHQIARYVEYLTSTTESFADVSFTTNVGRAHASHRCAVVASTARDAIALLRAFSPRDLPARPVIAFAIDELAPDRIAAATALLQSESIVRAAVEQRSEKLASAFVLGMIDVWRGWGIAPEIVVGRGALAASVAQATGAKLADGAEPSATVIDVASDLTWPALASSVATLYEAGASIDFTKLDHRPRRRVRLPT